MLSVLGRAGLLCAILYPQSCGQHAITVQYRVAEDYRFSRAERRVIQEIADTATRDARRLLPAFPRRLVIVVRTGEVEEDLDARTGHIEEFDATGQIAGKTIYWVVDPHRGDDVVTIAKAGLRSFLFLTYYAAVRDMTVPRGSALDSVVRICLATAFARDFSGDAYPWPWEQYPEDIATWVDELMARVTF